MSRRRSRRSWLHGTMGWQRQHRTGLKSTSASQVFRLQPRRDYPSDHRYVLPLDIQRPPEDRSQSTSDRSSWMSRQCTPKDPVGFENLVRRRTMSKNPMFPSDDDHTRQSPWQEALLLMPKRYHLERGKACVLRRSHIIGHCVCFQLGKFKLKQV